MARFLSRNKAIYMPDMRQIVHTERSSQVSPEDPYGRKTLQVRHLWDGIPLCGSEKKTPDVTRQQKGK